MVILPLYLSRLLCGGLVANSCLTLATPWTIAHQTALSTRFPREDYCGLPFHSPGDLRDPEIKHQSPTLQADSLPTETSGKHLSQFSSVTQSCLTP